MENRHRDRSPAQSPRGAGASRAVGPDQGGWGCRGERLAMGGAVNVTWGLEGAARPAPALCPAVPPQTKPIFVLGTGISVALPDQHGSGPLLPSPTAGLCECTQALPGGKKDSPRHSGRTFSFSFVSLFF